LFTLNVSGRQLRSRLTVSNARRRELFDRNSEPQTPAMAPERWLLASCIEAGLVSPAALARG